MFNALHEYVKIYASLMEVYTNRVTKHYDNTTRKATVKRGDVAKIHPCPVFLEAL